MFRKQFFVLFLANDEETNSEVSMIEWDENECDDESPYQEMLNEQDTGQTIDIGLMDHAGAIEKLNNPSCESLSTSSEVSIMEFNDIEMSSDETYKINDNRSGAGDGKNPAPFDKK